MATRPSPDSPLAARFVASPNHGERRGHSRPNCLILHYTGMPTGEAAFGPGYTADARNRPGAHPNVDILLAIAAGGEALRIEVVAAG